MSSLPDARDFLRRIDVRLGLGLAAAIGALLVLLMAIFFLMATHETAELLEEHLAREMSETTGSVRTSEPDAGDMLAIRRVDATGRSVVLRGVWPSTGRGFPVGTSALRLALAQPEDRIERSVRQDAGVLEGAVSLRQFAAERSEQLVQILWSLALAAIGVIGVAVVATRIALAPLRRATRAVDAVDEHHLNARIPVRGTGDDLDYHARALNRVLHRLEDAFDRMAGFSAAVAHELRTPVNRMLNAAELALLRSTEDEVTRELLAVREAADGMRRLIEDLLLLARGEEGKLGPHIEPVGLRELAAELVELYRPLCEERRIVLGQEHADGAATVLGDRQLLQRALMNLLDNAVRHTPDGGRIDVSVSVAGDAAELSVADSGSGIPAAERDRIFDRFVRLDAARTTPGSGLGLALVRMIVQSFGGAVRADAARLGGACLRIRLPLAASSAEGDRARDPVA